MTTPEAFERIEMKVDRLMDAMTRLVLIDERQLMQANRVDKLELRVSLLDTGLQATNEKVTTWVQRGFGAWAAVLVAWAIFEATVKYRM